MMTFRIARSVTVFSLMISIAALFGASSSSAFQTGLASYYRHGKLTANGERFNPRGLTAAHRTLPFGTLVRVMNVRTGKAVVVRINDRGPFIRGRIIDLALGAAERVGLTRSGVARVTLSVLN
jgi:rare lipoprotein A